MKRDKKNVNEVTTHFPLFVWKECQFCHSEFRRESGFKWSAWKNFSHHACGDCCASITHCSDMIDWRQASINAELMGEIPPAPPMRTYGLRRGH